MIGEVRQHKTNGLYYVYEFHPETERLRWLRLDTFIWGRWRDYPNKTATAANLLLLSLNTQKSVVKKYQRSASTIEVPVKKIAKKSAKKSPLKNTIKKTPCNNKKTRSLCTSSKGCRWVSGQRASKGQRARKSYCRTRLNTKAK